MKHLKKLIAAALTMFVAFAVGTVALAEGNKITVNNAAKGETYAVYKILGATENGKGGIDYIGPIPSEFADVLETTTVGTDPNTYSAIGIVSGKTGDDLKVPAQNFVKRIENAESFQAVLDAKTFAKAAAKFTATGNSVVFENVEPGYYVVVSTQGSAVMIDSTTPNATINEKNTTTVTVDKKVEKESYSIGDTIKYTLEIEGANYQTVKVDGKDVDKPVTAYTITDTLPPFLSGTTVTKITIGDVEYKVNGAVPQFTNKKIEIPWADFDATNKVWTSKYANGTKITVEYQATLTSTANIGGNNTNRVTVKPKLGEPDGTDDKPNELQWEDTTVVKTYAAALKKTDGTKALAGAQFTIAGLVATEKEAGVWVVSSYSTANTTPTTLTTDENGKLYIVGIAQGTTLVATETKAPEGYNLLQGTTNITPQLVATASSKTHTWEKYDADGNLIDSKSEQTNEYTENIKTLAQLDAAAVEIVNNEGTELPSTGGIGTTIFYIVGGIMVVAAGVLLVTKKRVANN